MPPKGWTEPDPDGKSLVMDLSILQDSRLKLSVFERHLAYKIAKGAGTRHSMGLPIHVYPLYEHGRQAHKRQTAQQNAHESANLYAAFDEIGSKNEYSWNFKEAPKSAEYIGTIAKRNRMICDPCKQALIDDT